MHIVKTLLGTTVTMNEKGIRLYSQVDDSGCRGYCIGFRDTTKTDWYWAVGGNGWSRAGMFFDSVEAAAIMKLIEEVQKYAIP